MQQVVKERIVRLGIVGLGVASLSIIGPKYDKSGSTTSEASASMPAQAKAPAPAGFSGFSAPERTSAALKATATTAAAVASGQANSAAEIKDQFQGARANFLLDVQIAREKELLDFNSATQSTKALPSGSSR